MPTLTHFDESGHAHMVDVSEKPQTARSAVATGTIRVSKAVFSAIQAGSTPKGDVLGTARIAGIMGVKQTAALIPLCHTLLLSGASIDFSLDEAASTVTATCTVRCSGQTGVEMEALTGVSVALLTIYDMCKALDQRMEIGSIHLLEKHGGKSVDFT